MRKILQFTLTFLFIVGVVSLLTIPLLGGTHKAIADDASNLSKWHEVKRLGSGGTELLRTERYFNDDLLLSLSQDSGHVSVVKTDAIHNFKDARVLENVYSGKMPYDVRFYGDFVIVGNRGENFINIYKFHTDGAPSYLEMIQRLNLGGQAPVKLIIDERRGLLFSPNQETSNMSIVDLKPLKVGDNAKLLSAVPVNGGGGTTRPARIVIVSNTCTSSGCNADQHEVIMTFNSGTNNVTTYKVDDPINPELLNIIPTGADPYYGEGNGEVFFVDSQKSSSLTAIDMRDPLNMKLLETGSNILVGDAPLIPQFVNNKKTVLWTVQGMDSGSNPNVQGYITSLDLSDPFGKGIAKTATISTRRGCGGLELIKHTGQSEPDTMLSINTPDGTISIIDIRDPAKPVLINNIFLANNGEPHYVKLTKDGHHMIATDRKNNVYVMYSDVEEGQAPELIDETNKNKEVNGPGILDIKVKSNNQGTSFGIRSTTPQVCTVKSGTSGERLEDVEAGSNVLFDEVSAGICKIEAWQNADDNYMKSDPKSWMFAIVG